jgi:hypothetical protein
MSTVGTPAPAGAQYSEQVSALITPEARARLDALTAARQAERPERSRSDASLGSVIRDVLDAGLARIERDR